MPNGNGHTIYRFDGFSLDPEKLMLYDGEREITLPPKVVKTLAVLVESKGEILSKDELIEAVWSDSVVEESNLSQYLYLLRKTLGNTPDGEPYIETLRRRGYRFNGKLQGTLQERVESAIPQRTHAFAGARREGNLLRLVEVQPEPQTLPEMADQTLAPVKMSRALSWKLLLVLAAGVAATTVGSFFFLRSDGVSSAESPKEPQEILVTRLTTGLIPIAGTISPDGNYFVYHELDGDLSRMFVQQVGQTSRVEIATSTDMTFHGKTFSPDGQYVYYMAVNKADHESALFRVPTIGGPALRIVKSISPVSFSPDGSQMVFLRGRDPSGTTSIVITDKDGKGERTLLQRKAPKVLTGFPTFSSDGKLIAFAENDTYDPKLGPRTKVFVATVRDGDSRELSNETWDTAYRTVWTRDGKGIVFIGTRENEGYSTRRDQLYFVSYPEGRSRRITLDGNRHDLNSLGITKDDAIFTVHGNRASQIWSMSSSGSAASAVQISRGTGDGRGGLSPLPDGRIGFVNRVDDEINIWVANPDGTNAKQVAMGLTIVDELRADPHGRYFVFSSMHEGKNRLFRIDSDGGNLKQLTSGNGREIDSTISPDGNTIVFESAVYLDDVLVRSLWKMPATGGDPELLSKTQCWGPAFSPDGSMIACFRSDKPGLVVLSAVTGAELESHHTPANASWNDGAGWTLDGRGLVYTAYEKDASNLWVLPRDGTKPTPLTDFTGGVIHRYAFSPDGSRLFVARGFPIQDAILIRNYR